MDNPNYRVETEARQHLMSRLFIAYSVILLAIVIAMSALMTSANAAVLVNDAKGTGSEVTAPDCGSPGWQVVPSNVRPHGRLQAVSAVSASDIWAVGYYEGENGARTLTVHWDGASWSYVSSPNVNTKSNALYGVTAISANDVWAVGFYNGTYSPGHYTLTLHWNGTIWAIVPSPNPSPNSFPENELRSVAAVSANSVWAVGHYLNSSGSFRTLTMRWNGYTWTSTSSANDGQPNDQNYLYGVTAGHSENDLWAAGCFKNNASGVCNRTLILRWKTADQSWHVATSPNPSNSSEIKLYGITSVSSTELWAVGGFRENGGNWRTLTLRYFNNAWSIVPSANPGNGAAHFYAVSAVSANDVWAVGTKLIPGDPYATQIEHWNGSSWITMTGPNAGSSDNVLFGVAAISTHNVWAVGYFDQGGDKPLIQHYNPCP